MQHLFPEGGSSIKMSRQIREDKNATIQSYKMHARYSNLDIKKTEETENFI